MTKKQKPLWRCPRCGHRFVTRHLWHSCGRYRLADHFRNNDPEVRRLFNRFRSLVRACGPVTVYAQKTRITFQGRVRFAGCTPKQRWLDGGLWLTRQHSHHAIRRVERIAPKCYAHYFRIQRADEMDSAFTDLVREAYAVGQQEHLDHA